MISPAQLCVQEETVARALAASDRSLTHPLHHAEAYDQRTPSDLMEERGGHG
jgi:hypothetical protein